MSDQLPTSSLPFNVWLRYTKKKWYKSSVDQLGPFYKFSTVVFEFGVKEIKSTNSFIEIKWSSYMHAGFILKLKLPKKGKFSLYQIKTLYSFHVYLSRSYAFFIYILKTFYCKIYV